VTDRDGPERALSLARVLAEIRHLARQRSDGLMTAEKLRRALGASARELDGALRELEIRGVVSLTPTLGDVVIVVLSPGPQP
jgi:hypothetical protein